MNKKLSFLAASMVIALAGCNGGSGNGNSNGSQVQEQGRKLTAIDGYLHKAKVFADANSDGQFNDGDKVLGYTDEHGQITIPLAYNNASIVIVAEKGNTIDMTRGLVNNNFSLATTPGATIVNPMTNLVMKQIRNGLDEAEAKKAVIAAVAESSGLAASEDLIFGDYIANASKAAQALNVIGEVLVDNAHLDVAKQLQVTQKVAASAQENIDNIENFAPEVIVPTGDSEIQVTPNTRPEVIKQPETINLELGQPISDVDVVGLFKDNDDLIYSISAVNGMNGLSLNNAQVSGTPQLAGTFEYHIFATDSHGARSYPAKLNLVVTSPNTAPTVNPNVSEVNRIKSDISNLSIEQYHEVDEQVDVSQLFVDADGDQLTINAVITDNVLQAKVVDGLLTISGVPTQSGEFTLTLTATDGLHEQQATQTVQLKIIKAVEPPLPPTSKLEFTAANFNNKVAKMGSFARADGEIAYAMMRNQDGVFEICWGNADGAAESYKSNISIPGEDFNNPRPSSEIMTELTQLDDLKNHTNDDGTTGYVGSTKKDCWEVTISEDGKLVESEVNNDGSYNKWEMLYQHTIGKGADTQYQIIMKYGDDELFWFDSTDTPFAQVNPVSSKVKTGITEYQLMEDSWSIDNSGNHQPNAYSVNRYNYVSDSQYNLSWVLPVYDGKHVNDWVTIKDADNREMIQLTDTDGDEPKTRTRYIHRDFGDFYINIEWDHENHVGAEDGIQYMLFSTNEKLMTELGNKLPIIKD